MAYFSTINCFAFPVNKVPAHGTCLTYARPLLSLQLSVPFQFGMRTCQFIVKLSKTQRSHVARYLRVFYILYGDIYKEIFIVLIL